MELRFKCLLLLVLFLAHGVLPRSALSARIGLHGWDNQNIKPYVVIEGDIEDGDFQKFEEIIFESGVLIDRVVLASKGGSAADAIKIGELIRTLHLTTEAPRGVVPQNAMCFESDVLNDDNCTCASACFLIYAAGFNRQGNILGLHRAYLKNDDLKKLEANKAFHISKRLNLEVEKYLEKMSVPSSIIEKLMTKASDQIVWLSHKEIEDNLYGYIPESRDWIISKCGSETELNDLMQDFSSRTRGKDLSKEQEIEKENLFLKMKLQVECESDLAYDLRQKNFSKYYSSKKYCEEFGKDLDFFSLIGKSKDYIERALKCYGFVPGKKVEYPQFIYETSKDYNIDYLNYGISLKYRQVNGYKQLSKVKLELINSYGKNYSGHIFKAINDKNISEEEVFINLRRPEYYRDVEGLMNYEAENLFLYKKLIPKNNYIGFVVQQYPWEDKLHFENIYFMDDSEFRNLEGKIIKVE